MTDLASKKQLAQETLTFGAQLSEGKKPTPRPGPHPSIRPNA
jgi:hypothetical protein